MNTIILGEMSGRVQPGDSGSALVNINTGSVYGMLITGFNDPGIGNWAAFTRAPGYRHLN